MYTLCITIWCVCVVYMYVCFHVYRLTCAYMNVQCVCAQEHVVMGSLSSLPDSSFI